MLAQGQAALDAILTVEGAGAVGIAAIRSGRLTLRAFPAVVVVSGANINAAKWRGVVDAGVA